MPCCIWMVQEISLNVIHTAVVRFKLKILDQVFKLHPMLFTIACRFHSVWI